MFLHKILPCLAVTVVQLAFYAEDTCMKSREKKYWDF